MLYIRVGNNRKQLYINIKAIGQVLFFIIWIAAYLYFSNQDYLALTGNNLIRLK